jgi:hypothetical protein
MVRWFRHYPGLARDEKLVAAALRSKQPIERVVWIWCAILEDASARNDHGLFAIDAEEVSYFLRTAEGEVALILTALEQAGRIDAGRVCAWDKRQFPSDHSSLRVAAWRASKRAGDCNVTRPIPKRYCNGPESETESESEKETVPVSGNGHAALATLHPKKIVECWNLIAERIGKPLVRDLTESRRQSIKARIGQYSVEDFIAVLGKIERSAFLRGDSGWHGCTFDWVIKRANFQKIVEGNYDH